MGEKQAYSFRVVPLDIRQRQQSSLEASTSNRCANDEATPSPKRRLNEIHRVSRGSRQHRQPGFFDLVLKNPVAAAALVPDALILFSAGAIAGAVGK